MPSSRTAITEDPARFTVPVGSERVVNIRRLSKENPNENQTEPLSVNTSYPSRINMTEMDIQEREMVSRRKFRSNHRTKSRGSRVSERNPSDSGPGRVSRTWSTTNPEQGQDRGKVISYLEMDLPGPPRSIQSIPISHEGELGSHLSTHKESKSHRKTYRSKERQSWLSLKAENTEPTRWRHSNIFAPEEPKVRSSHHRTRKSKSTVVQPSPNSSMWSPFIPVPVSYFPSLPYTACQKCGDAIMPPPRSVSYDALGLSAYRHGSYLSQSDVPGVPYPPYSSDNLFVPPRFSSQHSHYHQHFRLNRSKTVPPTAFIVHNQDGDRPTRVPSLGTVLSTSADDLGPGANNQTERVVMEIEYAEIDNSENKMSAETLRLIVRLAKHVRRINDLEEMAKQLKVELDKQLGERWQVVIGDDSFGSYLASLPGALANFRINRDVFLVWQT